MIIAIEIGGTKQQIAIGNSQGEIYELNTVKLGDDTNPQNILSWLDKNVSEFINKNEIDRIVIGYGGPVDLSEGRVICSMQVGGWDNISLKEHFEERFHIPCMVYNDTDCGGMGEFVCGAGKGCKNLFYANIGTGIGGCIITNNRLYTGGGRGAGEIGHIRILNFRTKKMEKLEHVCAGPAIEKSLSTPGYIPKDSLLFEVLNNNGKVTALDLSNAVAKGDEFAITELDNIADACALGFSNAITLLSPDKLVIGGGLANMGEMLIGRIRKSLEKYVYSAFIGYYEVEQSRLLDNAVIVGALCAEKMNL